MERSVINRIGNSWLVELIMGIINGVHEIYIWFIEKFNPYLWKGVWFILFGVIQLSIINDPAPDTIPSGLATLANGEMVAYFFMVMAIGLAHYRDSRLMTFASLLQGWYVFYLLFWSNLLATDARVLLASIYLVDGALGGSWGALNVVLREEIIEARAAAKATKIVHNERHVRIVRTDDGRVAG